MSTISDKPEGSNSDDDDDDDDDDDKDMKEEELIMELELSIPIMFRWARESFERLSMARSREGLMLSCVK